MKKIVTAADMRSYQLPAGILPYAPRIPLALFSGDALESAASLSSNYTEKRGMITHAFRSLQGQRDLPVPHSVITIESHLDATKIPSDLADKFVALGFEPDGFVQFNPPHYTDHFTLKFRVDAEDHGRREELRHEVENRSRSAFDLQNGDDRVGEGYIELEIYPATSRRSWDGFLHSGWLDAFPLSENALQNVETPCVQKEAIAAGLDLMSRKHADIHIKIARHNSETDRQKLIQKLSNAGFYPVFTWAGNDICTAQFLKAGDAERVRTVLEDYFDAFGGCSEMTTEPVAGMWRTERKGRLATVPPLICAIGT